MSKPSCFRVEKGADGAIASAIERPAEEPLEADEVRIAVRFSSLNYKDSLAARGHPGVVRRLPLVPGIDAAGVIVESRADAFQVGERVLATGHEFGVAWDGGWSTSLRAPARWVVPAPPDLSFREAMILGTAGFTAAQCLEALKRQEIEAGDGEILVTGASGGVGCCALAILRRAGYSAVAASGKSERHPWLEQIGAARCIGRDEANIDSPKPLLSSQWAGAIDTVGGNTLHTILRTLRHGGCVAACGLVGGHELSTTVYPFLLRGVTLAGIDSAEVTPETRRRIWSRLAGEWRPDNLESLVAAEVELTDLPEWIERIQQGGVAGRVVVRLPADESDV